MKNIVINTRRLSPLAKSCVFVLGLSLFTSCTEENVLDLEPYSSISESAAFSNPELIQLSVDGVYNAAQIGTYNGGAGRGYPFGGASIQQSDNRGEDAVNTATFYQLTYTATYDPSTANNVHMWSETYRLINRANIVIEGVTGALENGIITQEEADDYIGQALFFRGIAHLELLTHFARPYDHTADASHPGVPYRDVPFTTEENIEAGLEQGRNTVAETYTKALADLTNAENLLMTKAERGGDYTRATSEAAIAYKTRAYLNMGEWDQVISEGNKIVGTFEMTAEPIDPFKNGYSNSESIFSLLNTATNNPGVNAALASQYNRRGLVVISPIVWRNEYWLEDDKRRGEDFVEERSGALYTVKYTDATTYTDPSPLIRFAEVALNMAEANARLDNTAEAVRYLNLVRDRSLADPSTQSYTTGDFSSSCEVVEAIIAERRIEFVLEGRRWADIHRLQNDGCINMDGIPAKVANGFPTAEQYELGSPYTGPYGVQAIPYDDHRFVWPIPQAEINANPTLAGEQNPGW